MASARDMAEVIVTHEYIRPANQRIYESLSAKDGGVLDDIVRDRRGARYAEVTGTLGENMIQVNYDPGRHALASDRKIREAFGKIKVPVGRIEDNPRRGVVSIYVADLVDLNKQVRAVANELKAGRIDWRDTEVGAEVRRNGYDLNGLPLDSPDLQVGHENGMPYVDVLRRPSDRHLQPGTRAQELSKFQGGGILNAIGGAIGRALGVGNHTTPETAQDESRGRYSRGRDSSYGQQQTDRGQRNRRSKRQPTYIDDMPYNMAGTEMELFTAEEISRAFAASGRELNRWDRKALQAVQRHGYENLDPYMQASVRAALGKLEKAEKHKRGGKR